MYEAYYGFSEKPFALSPDPKYLFLSRTHREVLGHLVYGIEEGEGFMAISGEVGTGKTTLCRTLLERQDHCDIAYLFNPTLTPTDLIKAINSEFGLSTFGDSRAELIDVLNTHLLDRNSEGFRVLVIIDEAQNLPDETLEQLRLLGNLESQKRKLLQILLIGQPELDRKLEARNLRQLRQRISVWWRLGALSVDETRGYIRHRLRVACGDDRPYFTNDALDRIHEHTGGVPRLINVLANRSLLAGFGNELDQIPAELVQELAEELRHRPTRRQVRRRALGMGVGGAVAAASAALGLSAALSRAPEAPQVANTPAKRPVVASEVSPPVAAAPPPPERRAPAPIEAMPPAAAAPALPPIRPHVPPPETALQDSNDRIRPDRERLDRLLGALTPEAARRESLSALLRVWGRDTHVRGDVSRRRVTEILTENGLVPVELTGLHAFITHDTPAIVSLATTFGSPRSTLALQIEGSSVLLDALVPNQLVEIPIDVLRARWSAPVWTVRSSTDEAEAPRLHVVPSARSTLPRDSRSMLARE